MNGGGEGLAASLEAPIKQREATHLLEEEARRLFLALALAKLGVFLPKLSSIERSAPPEKLSLPEAMTQPLIAGFAATSSTIRKSSSPTSVVMTFIERPGMSQVASAMPWSSVSKRKFVRFMDASLISWETDQLPDGKALSIA